MIIEPLVFVLIIRSANSGSTNNFLNVNNDGNWNNDNANNSNGVSPDFYKDIEQVK